MPLINIFSSIKIPNKIKLLENSAEIVAELTNKSKRYVMVKIHDQCDMYFDNDNSTCCLVEIKSIGSLDTSKMSLKLSQFFSNEIGVDPKKIYISFDNVNPSMWAWNGSPFG